MLDKKSWLLVLVSISILTVRASADALTKDDLITLVEAYRQHIEDIEFTFDSVAKILEEDEKRKNARTIPRFRNHLRIAGNMKWTDMRRIDPKSEEELFVYQKISAYDGDTYRTFQPGPPGRPGRGSIQADPTGWRVDHNYVFYGLMWPRDASDEGNHRKDLVALLRSGGVEVMPERENLFAVNCVVIDGWEGKLKVWLDIEHGAIPRQIILRNGHADDPIVETHTIRKLNESRLMNLGP